MNIFKVDATHKIINGRAYTLFTSSGFIMYSKLGEVFPEWSLLPFAISFNTDMARLTF
jgi:hypothetical protein